ncbi:MAG: hypothetical protein SCARUB_05049 [Candidatus Scalindua rubra]|uniref:Lysozyme n=1 Tax=Candidatus Scalindua rubra TaxID=1872076 RepID=A0A1E3X2P6_9BACT|nr:MAG: hypothetical protein SCARUB_05049 [Candidatus Scalindua rubra]
MNIDEIIKSIKNNEGFRSRVYKDSLGFDTIGYGFAIKNLELSESISDILLKQKLLMLIINIHERFQWFRKMPDKIQGVVVEMCYQLGITGFSKFRKTIAYLANKRWKEASKEMMNSRWAVQTPNRAKELSEIVRES